MMDLLDKPRSKGNTPAKAAIRLSFASIVPVVGFFIGIVALALGIVGLRIGLRDKDTDAQTTAIIAITIASVIVGFYVFFFGAMILSPSFRAYVESV
jgi:uncharacterized membrane protein YfcA